MGPYIYKLISSISGGHYLAVHILIAIVAFVLLAYISVPTHGKILFFFSPKRKVLPHRVISHIRIWSSKQRTPTVIYSRSPFSLPSHSSPTYLQHPSSKLSTMASSSSIAPAKKSNQALLSTPLHGLYIPIGLLVVGVAIIDYNYVPHAVAAAAVLGGLKVFRGRKFMPLF